MLWVLLGLFVFRVVAQLLVANGQASFLPPMEAWQSGVVPYPALVVGQLALIALLARICLDITRHQGLFAARRPGLGMALTVFGCIYLAAMTARYVLYLSPSPAERWVHLPVFFHWVLAGFVFVLAAYNRVGERSNRLSRS
jgi:hypothetical protein